MNGRGVIWRDAELELGVPGRKRGHGFMPDGQSPVPFGQTPLATGDTKAPPHGARTSSSARVPDVHVRDAH